MQSITEVLFGTHKQQCEMRAVHAGSLVADEAGAPGDLRSTVQSAKWAFSITPLDGWGARAGKQQATAGWLAALPVFEPHWQACIYLWDSLSMHGMSGGLCYPYTRDAGQLVWHRGQPSLNAWTLSLVCNQQARHAASLPCRSCWHGAWRAGGWTGGDAATTSPARRHTRRRTGARASPRSGSGCRPRASTASQTPRSPAWVRSCMCVTDLFLFPARKASSASGLVMPGDGQMQESSGHHSWNCSMPASY